MALTYGKKIAEGGFGIVLEGTFDKKPCIVKRQREISYNQEKLMLTDLTEKNFKGVPFLLKSNDDLKELVFKPFQCKQNHTSPILDVFDFISEKVVLKENQALFIFNQVLDILNELKKLDIFHGDVKDENVIICQECGEIQLIDFGSSQTCKKWDNELMWDMFAGTYAYSPPEFVIGDDCTFEGMIVWSCGILLCDLTEGDIPWEAMHDICFADITKKFNKSSEKVRELIVKCLAKEASKRIKFDEMYCEFKDKFPVCEW